MSNPFPRLLILGHRGAPDEATENTLESLALAVRQGADGVELDVRVTADGVPVVIHDDTLERTFGLPGVVSKLTWPALQRVTEARLPSLQQVAAWAAASGAWVNVELKSGGAEEEIVGIVEQHELLPRTFFSSFDPAAVAAIGRACPDARRFFLTERWDDKARDGLVASGASGLCLRGDAASAVTLEVLRQEGLPVVVWTVDDRSRMLELARNQVAAIITNRPATAVAALRTGREGG